MIDNLIGPLTAEEWCAFRMRVDDNDEGDDLLQCCGVTSDMRDAIFFLLRMGGQAYHANEFLESWKAMVEHGLPDGLAGELLQKLHDHYAPAEVQG